MKTQKGYLEHANITVSDINEGIKFFHTAFPTFKIRGGAGEGTEKWVHFGDDNTYVAINQGDKQKGDNHPNYLRNGINHIGFVVDDVETLAERLLNNGFVRDYPKQVQQYRIRDYFADADGNQYEFVQYLSEKSDERNDYSD